MEPLVPLAFTHAPRIRGWMERVRAQPSVARALALGGRGDPRREWAPGPEINRWGYLNYVRCAWLFYDSSLAADVAQLRARVPTLQHLVCIDRAIGEDPYLFDMIADTRADDWTDERADPFRNLDDVVGIFPTGGTTGPSKGVIVTNLGWGR